MIGLFGGTFDPIHKGHLHFAKEAKAQLKLDKVVFIPAAQNPLKEKGHATGVQRLEMLKRALGESGISGFEIYDGELKRPPPSYTIDTLHELLRREPASKFLLLMGSEVFESLPKWKSPEEILEKVAVAVVTRPGQEPLRRSTIRTLEIEPLDFSSTQIREQLAKLSPSDRLKSDSPVEGLQRAVWLYIKENQLYTVR